MAQATVNMRAFAVAKPRQTHAGCDARVRGLPMHQLRSQRTHLVGSSHSRRRPLARSSLSVTNISSWIPTPLPEPIKFPRARLNQRFAVLLLRSTYQAVDDLDFIPMDKFQIKFWKLRQSEYQPYVLSYDPLKPAQGELSDPLYFDFISFAQYATISREIPDAAVVFEERDGAEGTVKVVQRDPSLRDNKLLPGALRVRVGELIYTGIAYGFEDAVFNGPLPCQQRSFECAVAGVERLMQVFVENGYCIKAEVSEVEAGSGGGGRFRVRLNGTATLWGCAALASRGSIVSNDYTAFASEAFLRASGFKEVKRTSRSTDTYVEETWSIA